jgi:hypothetical protein
MTTDAIDNERNPRCEPQWRQIRNQNVLRDFADGYSPWRPDTGLFVFAGPFFTRQQSAARSSLIDSTIVHASIRRAAFHAHHRTGGTALVATSIADLLRQLRWR